MNNIEFEYEGLAFKYSSLKRDEAKEAKLKALFDKHNVDLWLKGITSVPAMPINWPIVHKHQSTGREDLLNEIFQLLIALGLLRPKRNDSWEILGDNVNFNPSHAGVRVFFMREVDALSYAYYDPGDTQFDWQVVHHDVVVHKSQVMAVAKAT